MDRILEFAVNNYVLVLLLVGVLIALVVNELLLATRGVKSLEPGSATHLYNREQAQFIDLRGDAEFHKGHLPEAVNVPQSSLSKGLGAKLEKDKERPIIVYCTSGMQSGKAAATLKKQGFSNVYQLKGGFQAWQGAGYPIERKR
ncbi:rhodanese-like domain-containing protein [Ectothiorhodospiraceae bacterium WFHF3C12]|nr:rhodanese-like domain-containing protein [Ectothiorhodospiraceae bacterium WFHF3C12]